MRQLVLSESITQREYKSLGKYFSDINKISLLAADEEVLLARKIKEGDKAALDRLTTTNLRFVVSVAKQYQNQGLTLGDLINEGNLGLIHAAGRYDESKGFKFISYAVWWIRQAILAAIAEHARIVRMPYNQLTLLSKLNKAASKLEQDYNRKASNEELAQYLDIPVDKVTELMSKFAGYVSIHEPMGDSEYTLSDVLHNTELRTDHDLVKESISNELKHSFKVLNKRDRELLVLFFGLGSASPLPLEEIGRRLKISKEHVGRLKEKALKKLRNCSNAPVLLSCLT